MWVDMTCAMMWLMLDIIVTLYTESKFSRFTAIYGSIYYRTLFKRYKLIDTSIRMKIYSIP